MKKRPDPTGQTRKNLNSACWKCLDESGNGKKVNAAHITRTAGYHRTRFYVYSESAELLGEIAEEDLLEG
ncbi:MAG: hypothetical protein ACI4WR_06090 [Bulleidia sp.]